MPHIDALLKTRVALESRDTRSDLTPNETQRTTLIVAGCYFVAIAILWLAKYINIVAYPFKLLTVAMHQFSHALAGVLTCAHIHIHSIELDPAKGGMIKMSGGISAIFRPAGYIGSSLIGACLIACGFDTNASKVATLVLGVVFLVSLSWVRRDGLSWLLMAVMAGLILAFWFIAQGSALRYLACPRYLFRDSVPADIYQVLFFGVMNCMYALWDTIDRKIRLRLEAKTGNTPKPEEPEECCPSPKWGVIWVIIAFIFFAAGVLVGLVVFKKSAAEQLEAGKYFIPTPGT